MRASRSEIDYRAIFDNTLDGLVYCQMVFDKGKKPIDFIYLEVSRNFYELTGLKQVIGKKVTDLIPGIKKTNPELFEIYGRVALTGRSEKFESYLEPLARWFFISVYSPRRGYFIAIFQNISERKQIEKNLENAKIAARNVYVDLNAEKNLLTEIKAKDEAILKSIADGLVVKDKEGKIILVNKSFEEILGWRAAEVSGKFLSQVMPLRDGKD